MIKIKLTIKCLMKKVQPLKIKTRCTIPVHNLDSFLETGKFKINEVKYSLKYSPKKLDKVNKPYTYYIKNKIIEIFLNMSYITFKDLQKDYDLYKNLIILEALSEAISEIKGTGFNARDDVFEIYQMQRKKIA